MSLLSVFRGTTGPYVGLAIPVKIVSRPLDRHEQLRYGDIIEDIVAGDRSRAEKGSFYGSLVGLTAAQVKQLPQVNEVIREEIDFADD